MIRLCTEDGRCAPDASLEDVKAALHAPSGRFWLDAEGLTDEKEREILDLFGFTQRAIQRCLDPSRRPKIVGPDEKHDAIDLPYFYLVVHGPHLELTRRRNRDAEDPEKRFRELDIFLTERYLITIHKQPSKPASQLQ